MKNPKTIAWWFVLVAALTTWLGWGIRGQIGHANGAMIPGALLALAVSVLLRDKAFSPGLAVGLTAVGCGFGADQTTLETAGFLMGTNRAHLVRLGIAYPGLAIKGAVWALFGGIGLGLALVAYLYHKRDVVIGVLLLVATFFVGVWAIDRPKLLYFSYQRREIWAGLLLGGIVLLAWLTVRGKTPVPLVVALCGAVGGGVGYPIAVTLAAAGLHSSIPGVDWWKVAETTFGAFIGAGVGTGAYLVRKQLPARTESAEPAGDLPSNRWVIALGGALLAAAATALYQHVLPWLLLGALLWCVTFYSRKAAWQVGVTLTFGATAANLVSFWHHEQGIGNAAMLWTLAGLATVFVAWKVAGWAREENADVARRAFLFLMWAIYVLSCLKTFINAGVVHPTAETLAAAGGRWPYLVHVWSGSLLVQSGFTVAVIALTFVVYTDRDNL